MDEFPHLRAWYDRIRARPAVARALKQADQVQALNLGAPDAEEQRRVLFGQRAR
jgi:GST-like protein